MRPLFLSRPHGDREAESAWWPVGASVKLLVLGKAQDRKWVAGGLVTPPTAVPGDSPQWAALKGTGPYESTPQLFPCPNTAGYMQLFYLYIQPFLGLLTNSDALPIAKLKANNI